MKKCSLKKLVLILVLPMIFTCFFGCNPKPDYFSYVSDLRKDIFVGENTDFCVVVWAGARETPYASDGVKNETKLNLSVKVTAKQEKGEKITATVCYDESEYSGQLTFHPVKSGMATNFEVKTLPEKQLIIRLDYGDESCTIGLESALNPDTIPYTKALNKAIDYCFDYVSRHTKHGEFLAEISLRLLSEKGNNYYYVGFTAKNGEKKAVLIDGADCSVLAEKDD